MEVPRCASWAIRGVGSGKHLEAGRHSPEQSESLGADQPPHHAATLSGGDRTEPLCLNLHGIPIELRVSPAGLLAHCQSLFHRYISPCQRQAGIIIRLALVDALSPLPALPVSGTVVRQVPGLVCTADRQSLFLQLDGKGSFVIDRLTRTITGQVTPELLAEQHLLDRLLVGSLALLLREWSIFPVHGFSATRDGQAALLVGGSGCGKTTAGLALLRSGWGFLANDLPLLHETGQGLHVLSCPERVHSTVETASRFPELQSLAGAGVGKFGFHVEDVYPDALADRAVARWLLFPRVREGRPTRMRPMTAPEALIALLPHSLATWDRSKVAAHFSLLERLAKTTLAYQLDLGSGIEEWASLLTDRPGVAP